jgi:hypothetical protein
MTIPTNKSVTACKSRAIKNELLLRAHENPNIASTPYRRRLPRRGRSPNGQNGERSAEMVKTQLFKSRPQTSRCEAHLRP